MTSRRAWTAVLLLSTAAVLVALASEEHFDPYEVLGVHRRASVPEIRKAYKAMAKEWHPDKNESPEAQEKFVQITKAAELLTDPERRKQYDNYGVTEDAPNFRQKHDYSKYGRFDPFDAFEELFADKRGGGFRFRFGGGGGGGGSGDREQRVFQKMSITSKAYYSTVLPNSAKQPYLILFYSDWCFTCSRVEPIWRKLVEELDPVGFGLATVHTEHEKDLSRKTSVGEVPHLVMLLDGKVIHYKEGTFGAVKIIDFIRRKFPYKLVSLVDDWNVDDFLGGWRDNRVRVLLFGKADTVRMRYLTTAFKYRNRAKIAYVNMHNAAAKKVLKRFGVSTSTDSLLLFQENVSFPAASLSMKELSASAIAEVLEAHPFLQLPRLSSQDVFDALCPPESSRIRKRLCVVLVTKDAPDHEAHRQALRDFIADVKFSPERVRFTYVLYEKQAEFVKSLVASGGKNGDKTGSGTTLRDSDDPTLRVVILWRREAAHLKYEWFPRRWESVPSSSSAADDATAPVSDGAASSAAAAAAERGNETREELRRTLQQLLTGNEVLTHEAVVKELFDEHAQSLLVRIANRLIDTVETIRDNVTKEEILPAVSLVVTVGLIIVGGYIMSYLVKMEEESVQRQLGAKGMKVDKKGKVVPELKVHELRAETYNGMVRLLKPGCRTIVLIVDRESKDKLVPKFYKFAWPYRRNKTLMFGFMYIEKGLPWFKKILNLTLPEPRDININPKNCIGTVMSLNGHRRYFCMYHAKHPEGSRRKLYQANNGAVAGAFMGFDSDLEDSASDAETDVEAAGAGEDGAAGRKENAPFLDSPDHLPIFEDQLLDGLQNWLDRLFEGSTYRYHINYWPEFPISPANFSSKTN